MPLRQVLHGQLRIAEDNPQNIVEIMGHTACQCTNGLHFMGLAKFILQPFLFHTGFFDFRDIA